MSNEFQLRLHARGSGAKARAHGQIVLGDYREKLRISLEFWTPQQYFSNWLNSSRLMLEGAERGCFIVNLCSPIDDEVAWGMGWEFFRVDDDIVFQNRMIIPGDPLQGLSGLDPTPWVEARQILSENGLPISEWRLAASDLQVALQLKV